MVIMDNIIMDEGKIYQMIGALTRMRPLTDEEMEMLRSYLWADSGGGDLTSEIFEDEIGTAEVLVEDDCVLSGLEAAVFLFEEMGCSVELNDGASSEAICGSGSRIMTVSGPVAGLLRAERVVLNLLSRMSAIATMAYRATGIAQKASPGTRVAGTRKTTPGFSLFEKRALIDGCALPHRKDLTSLAMIKDNHISALGGGPDAIRDGVEMIREVHGPYIQIEVEVEDIDSGIAAVDAGADIVMLDNMTPNQAGQASNAIREAAAKLGRKVVIEASGGIGLDNLAEYAPHVDVISMGSLTYGATPIGFKMEIIMEE